MEHELTVVEHLQELRKRIIISLVSLGIVTLASFPFAAQILKILKLPAAGYIKSLAFFSPQEALAIYLRVAFLSGFILALPIILYELWLFVSPGIEERFKKYAGYFIFFCSMAFILGVIFSYFVLLPVVLRFLLSFAKGDLEPVISAQNYVSFVVGIIAGTGLIFEMPILSFIFTKVGLINDSFLRKKERFAILAIFIIAAIVTPTTDAFNLIIFAVPMLILYEISIWVSKWAK